ncbi:MAG: CopG family transcriptional regulator [Thermosynechococcaceae cyanobacterium]
MSSVRKTISLPPVLAERLDKEAKRRQISASAVICELIDSLPESLPYAGLINDDPDLSDRIEEILGRVVG